MKSVSVDAVSQALAANEDIRILDVRTAAEYGRGHIQQSINIDLSSLHTAIEEAIPNKKQAIYVYCLSGSRSQLAVPLLERLGYANVYNVQSGLLAWRAKRYPLVS